MPSTPSNIPCIAPAPFCPQNDLIVKNNEGSSRNLPVPQAHKIRNIQSANPRSQSSMAMAPSGAREKRLLTSSYHLIPFEQPSQMKHSIRPKSSIGKRTMANSHDIKYVKKKELLEGFRNSANTFVLKKPELVII